MYILKKGGHSLFMEKYEKLQKISVAILRGAKGMVLFLLILGFSFLPGCGQKDPDAFLGSVDGFSSPLLNGQAKISFFDVGKGDAILIETAGHSMLVDSGYDDTSEVLLGYMEEQGISRLDYLVLTHFDKDHVGGADWIIEAVEIGTVLQPDYESDSKQYQEYVEAMEDKETSPVLVTETMELSLDGVDFIIDAPRQKNYEEENDFSLVISMTCGEIRFLFAGDCEKERLEELLEQKEFALPHDVLKVPHHGRKEKNTEEFLQAVSPKTAVVTNLEEKIEDGKVSQVLGEMETEVFYTGNGTVTCLCDGEKMEWQQ